MKITLTIAALITLIITGAASAAVIDFTGGTVYFNGGGTNVTTSGYEVFQGVDYYEENGFKLDFIGPGSDPFESIVGDYYGPDPTASYNDVIHGHWATGDFGGLTEIRVTKIDGTAFDLNYFILTSNTDTGGGAASGFEQVYIHASYDGTTIGYSQLLPPDDWGWGGSNPQIFLGPQFNNIKWFSFTAGNAVDCFGMDNFYINEPPPSPIDIYFDIKPGSCPNPFNSKSKGSVPMGIVGFNQYDWTDFDLSTIKLTIDDSDVEIYPMDIVEVVDSTEPYAENDPTCYNCFDADVDADGDGIGDLWVDTDGDGIPDMYDGDGYDDLVLKFDTQELAAAIAAAGGAEKGECVPMFLTGETFSGTTFGGYDAMIMLKKINPAP